MLNLYKSQECNLLQPPHVLLLFVIRGDGGRSTVKLERSFTLKSLIGGGFRSFSVLVEGQLAASQQHVHLNYRHNSTTINLKIWGERTLSHERLVALIVVLSHSCFLTKLPSKPSSSGLDPSGQN